IEKLVSFSLTAREWKRYKNLRVVPLPNGKGIGVGGVAPFEHFYEEADVRSVKMVGKLKLENRNLRGDGTAGAVLVAGGFHTNKITDILKQQKTSYLVVSPKISKVNLADGSAYLSVFQREKTPLDKLF